VFGLIRSLIALLFWESSGFGRFRLGLTEPMQLDLDFVKQRGHLKLVRYRAIFRDLSAV